MTPPETDLGRLLARLDPSLDALEYAFVQLPVDRPVPEDIEPFAIVHEDEGITLLLAAQEARRRGWANRFACRRITLQVHSALEAVGMLGTVAGWLSDAGIPANTLSAVAHDHLFVPSDRAEQALAVIERGSREWRRE